MHAGPGGHQSEGRRRSPTILGVGRGASMDDLLIRGATVIDGSGGTPRSLDVAVRDGRISAVEPRRTETAAQEMTRAGASSPPVSSTFIPIPTSPCLSIRWPKPKSAKVSPQKSLAIAASRSPRPCPARQNSLPTIYRQAHRGCHSSRPTSPATWPHGPRSP